MKKATKQRLFEVMSRLDKTFKPKLNEDMFSVEDAMKKRHYGLENGTLKPAARSYSDIVNSFPGHARQSNPVESPQYKWYADVLDFVNGNNNIDEKTELIKKFQNEFLGLDYDILQTPAEMVSWWLSPENQEFITDELNSGGGSDNIV
jgi:hypothetical protein